MEFENKDFYRNKSGIYQIKSTINGKIYIGSAVNIVKRYREHLSGIINKNHKCTYLNNHSKKHGNVFVFSVLTVCEKVELISKEQFFIDTLKPIVPNGFNVRLIATSDIGAKRNPESIKKAVETKRKNGHKPFSTIDRSHYKKENHPNFGKHLSDETKKKIGIGNKGKKLTDQQKERMRLTSTGRLHTDETKNKMSVLMIGNKRNQGKVHSNETRLKISKSRSISINQLSLGGVFIKKWDSAKHAGHMLRINYKNINSVTHGKRNKAGEFKWERSDK